jgi:hypothetical protein
MDKVICVGAKKYWLKQPLSFIVSWCESQYFVSSELLPVCGQGETLCEAMQDFYESFHFQWCNLVEVPQDSLTPGGLSGRKAMYDSVSDVEWGSDFVDPSYWDRLSVLLSSLPELSEEESLDFEPMI